ncbi:MAG TPA: hypothetical protein VF658_14260 [Pyrinomonadaceae bacterium]
MNAFAGVAARSFVATASTKTKVMLIADARRLPLGTIVTIEGSVTVASGAFKASVADEGFAIQDKSGGIYVSMSTGLGLLVRQRVRLTGKLAESLGLLVIVPVDAQAIEVRGQRGSEVKPENVLTGKIGETTEGRLVKVKGMMTREVVSDLPYGFRLFLNDGSGEIQVFVSASTKIDLSKLQMGQRLSVTGFSGQYKDHYEVSPRSQADIRLLIPRNRRPPP